MRIATYNVEWFDSLFDAHDRLVEDDAPAGRSDVTRAAQAAGLGRVLAELDADAVMVIEAPNQGRTRSTVAALEGFAARFGLRARKAAIGFGSTTHQEIALIYDPDALSVLHDPQTHSDAPRFDGRFRHELADGTALTVTFARPPLELLAQTATGTVLRIIGVHTKSKHPHGARDAEQAARISVDNRRKQFAQCVWLRRRVEAHLLQGDPLIVLGDFNDGPELDEFAALFPISGIEVVLGWDRPQELQLYDRHARMALTKHLAAAPASARFLMAQGHYFSALLDYVMLSPDLMRRDPRWRIWHPFDDPACLADAGLRQALLDASDHFPVSVDLAI